MLLLSLSACTPIGVPHVGCMPSEPVGSNRVDKEMTMREGRTAIDQIFTELFNVRAEAPEASDFLRTIMEPKQLLVYDIALWCETEMLKCRDAEAYFAACLMG